VWFINNLHIPIHNMVTLVCKIYIYMNSSNCFEHIPRDVASPKILNCCLPKRRINRTKFLSLRSVKFQISTEMLNKWVVNTFHESVHLLHMKHVLENINSRWVKRNPMHGYLFKKRLITLLLVKIITVTYNSYNFHFFLQLPILHWWYRSNFMYAYINLQ
jgi:hypothetical protein